MKDLDQAFIRAYDKQAPPSVIIRGLQSIDTSRRYHIDVAEIGPHVRIDAAACADTTTAQGEPSEGGRSLPPVASRPAQGGHLTADPVNGPAGTSFPYLPETIVVTPGAITDPPDGLHPGRVDDDDARTADMPEKFDAMHGSEVSADVRVDGATAPSLAPHAATEFAAKSHAAGMRTVPMHEEREMHGSASDGMHSSQPGNTDTTGGPAKTEFAGGGFRAAWEVDHFRWPQVCDDLREQEWLDGLGSQLATANREGLQVMAVTGRQEGEGGTTLALCLARSAALSGLEVALVDADFQTPNLAEQLGIAATATWVCAIQGRVSMEEAAVYAINDRITAFPLTAAATKNGITQLKQTADWLRQLTQHFDMVIIDAGVQASSSHHLIAVNTSGAIDAVTVVRDMRRTSTADIEGVVRRVHASGIEAVGIVENFGDWRDESLRESA